MVICRIFLMLALIWLGGCAAQGPTATVSRTFVPPAPGQTVYVVPFTTVMVPKTIQEGIFDRLVDNLNAGSSADFVILKQDVKGLDPVWRTQNPYLTGEIFGYVRESGCCSTELRIRTRLQLFSPGGGQPTAVFDYPREVLFDHDRSTLEVEEQRLILDVTQTLTEQLLATLRTN